MIIASGPLRNGGMVHAVAVTQPVQSWTVLRSHDDFYAVSDVLAQLLPTVPACPVIDDYEPDSGSEAIAVSVVNARNELQKWLTAVLTHPGSTETLAVRNFLTYNANQMLPQFEGVAWTSFDAEGAVVSPPEGAADNQQQQQECGQSEPNSSGSDGANYGAGNFDDMDMDEMFQDDGDEVEPPHDEDEDDYEYIRPSERYKPTDEAITEEDEMDMIEFANEVEMIEDIGSLAQSLGASHLGQSLLLQREIATRDGVSTNESAREEISQQGLNVGGSSHISGDSTAGGGGIRSAMEGATDASDDLPVAGFISRAPESAPRLDSFKMIKVIGKGSFGKPKIVQGTSTGLPIPNLAAVSLACRSFIALTYPNAFF